MALGRAYSVAVRGLDGEIVEIEADITSGLPGVHLVAAFTHQRGIVLIQEAAPGKGQELAAVKSRVAVLDASLHKS